MANNFAILGATGLVGSNIFKYLVQSPTPSNIITLTRRKLDEAPALALSTAPVDHTITQPIEADSSKWPAIFGDLCKTTTPPPIVFTGLATTRGAAGSFEKQYALEHDLNIELAKAAKDAGVKTFVLISSAGATKDSRVPYTRMKGEIEDDIEKCGFERYIIIRPGLLLGPRSEVRYAEGLMQMIARGLHKVSNGALSNPWAQSGDVVARAAVRAALDEGITGKKILGQHEIVQLGEKPDW
ncbi:hypothetical protein ABW21_db0208526 [Orbilia brochopaga]|nr:hypothetical protein ABW21_db0208526 [Drechslerella brochopaga]